MPVDKVAGKMSLVMFVHPACPCSVASIEELAQLMAQCGSHVDATLEVFQPTESTAEWGLAPTWKITDRIPGVVVRDDKDGILARQLGVQTSGQVLLYSEDGALVFSGGITRSRGHVGDNDGLETVIRLVTEPHESASVLVKAPVFGCAIYTSETIEIPSTSIRVQQ
jgi:hypothetical protein